MLDAERARTRLRHLCRVRHLRPLRPARQTRDNRDSPRHLSILVRPVRPHPASLLRFPVCRRRRPRSLVVSRLQLTRHKRLETKRQARHKTRPP